MSTKLVIDVSYWQKDISWKTVKDAGVEGVIIKVAEGTSYEQTAFIHLINARMNGLKVGFYCYSHATTPEEAKQEANDVVWFLNEHDVRPELGVWFDFEAPECLQAEDPTAICSSFVSFCNASGYMAGIYASLSTFTDVLDIRQLADYVPYWVAQYASECNFADYFPDKKLQGWQYSDKEYIGDTNVDMNEWYLD